MAGRYDFPGIQKAVSVGINAMLATFTWGAWLLNSPFFPILQVVENFFINWLANRGLIVLNVGAITIDGAIDQSRLDSALNEAITKLQQGRDKITAKEGAQIDQQVKSAFDTDADLGAQ